MLVKTEQANDKKVHFIKLNFKFKQFLKAQRIFDIL